MFVDKIIDLFVDPALVVTEFGSEIDANAKDSSSVGKSLSDVPEHALGDIAIVAEKRQESKHDAAHHHGYRRRILYPVLCFHDLRFEV